MSDQHSAPQGRGASSTLNEDDLQIFAAFGGVRRSKLRAMHRNSERADEANADDGGDDPSPRKKRGRRKTKDKDAAKDSKKKAKADKKKKRRKRRAKDKDKGKEKEKDSKPKRKRGRRPKSAKKDEAFDDEPAAKRQKGADGVREERRGRPPKRRRAQVVDGVEVYCYCKRSLGEAFMLGCDYCDDWFHGSCVDITEEDAQFLSSYKCPLCIHDDAVEKAVAQQERALAKLARKREELAEARDAAIARRFGLLGYDPAGPRANVRCLRDGCHHAVRATSKYCSDECGEAVMGARLAAEVDAWTQTLVDHGFAPNGSGDGDGVGDGDGDTGGRRAGLDPRLLEAAIAAAPAVIQKEYAELHEMLEATASGLAELDRVTAEAEAVAARLLNGGAASGEMEAGTRYKHGRNRSDTHQQSKECQSCGQVIQEARYGPHIVACANRLDAQLAHLAAYSTHESLVGGPFEFCDALNAQTKKRCKLYKLFCPFHSRRHLAVTAETVCGFPSDDGETCAWTMRTCPLHQGWVDNRLAAPQMVRLRLSQDQANIEYDRKRLEDGVVRTYVHRLRQQQGA